jgi:hypothetical protein
VSLTTLWNTATSTLTYLGVWSDPNADKIAEIKANLANASKTVADTAERAHDLRDHRKLTLTGSATDIRAGMAEATQLEKTARNGVKAARLFHKDLTNAPGVTRKDTDESSRNIDRIADIPNSIVTIRGELERAARVADAWYGQLAQLNNGLLPRLKVLELMKVPGIAPLLREHEGIQSGLLTAPGQPDTWNDAGVAKAAVDAKPKIDTLRDKIRELEAQGNGGDAYMDKLRQSADARFHNAMQGANLNGMLDEATELLKESNPKIERRHVAAAAGNQEGIRLRFVAALQDATTPDEIEAIVAKELKAFRDSVATFAQKVRTPKDQSQLQAGAEKAVAAEEQRNRYDELCADMTEALQRLYRAGGTTHDALKKRFDVIAIQADKTRNYRDPTSTTLPALSEEIERDYQGIVTIAERTINELRARIEAARDTLDEKHDELDGMLDSAQTGLVQAIENDLDDAEQFLQCEYDLAAAEPAKDLIAHAEQLLKDFDSMAALLRPLMTKLGTLATTISRLDARIVPAEDIASAQKRVTDLQSSNNGLTADELDQKITALQTDVTALSDFATAVTTWRRTAALALGTARTSFDAYAKAIKDAPTGTFTGPKPDPNKGVVKDRLDALTALSTAPIPFGGVPAHDVDWQQILGDFRVALANVWTGTALTNAQAVGDDTKKGTERAEAIASVTGEWETLKEVAEGVADAIPVTGRPRQDYQLLLKQLAGLEAEIAKDPAAAARQLADMRRRLGELPGTPDFNKGLAKAVGQVPDRWQQALEYTKQRLDALDVAAADAAKGSPFEAGMTILKKTLGDALKDLRADAFTPAASLLSAVPPPPDQQKQRRVAKEAALRTVRQYRTQVEKDPLFLHLQRNPFNVPVFGPLVRLLDDIEVEFLRAAC